MKYLIRFIAIALLLAACTKNNNKEVTVTGRLMQSCDTPAANKNGIIHLSGGGLLNNPSTSLEFTTDENGYFKVTHDKSFSEFSVRTSANHSVLEANISGDEKELGEVYIFPPSVSYYLKLEVNNNSYTNEDTLTYYDWGYPQNGAEHWERKIAGPFSSEIIDTVSFALNPDALPMRHNPPDHLHGPRIKLSYHLNEYDSWEDHDKFVYISTPHCQGEYQTVTIVID